MSSQVGVIVGLQGTRTRHSLKLPAAVMPAALDARIRHGRIPVVVAVVENSSSETSVTISDAKRNVGKANTYLSDQELLRRARYIHANTDFAALSAGLDQAGPWKHVQTVDHFEIYQRQQNGIAGVDLIRNIRTEVLCVGRVDASIEEAARILWPATEAEQNAAMTGLYGKNFIFGSIERTVETTACRKLDNNVSPRKSAQQLAVKTSSFTCTKVFGRNEQWCYLDFFQRKYERDGFTISQRALRPNEFTPGRSAGDHTRVHQLHGLAASYLVDQLPNRRGLRIIFHSWFDASQPPIDVKHCDDVKAQTRRLLVLAFGVTQVSNFVRHRRFSIPTSVGPVIVVDNARCPCCTCSLSVVKRTLATALSNWEKSRKNRCYLCGYLVCGYCWKTEQVESDIGRMVSIVICRRCKRQSLLG